MKILGIESSCDETSASVVEDGRVLHSLVIASSMDLHAQYGGVIPEIAARSHIEAVNGVIEQAVSQAFPLDKNETKSPTSNSDPWDQIDAIAVTYGAGLGGSLLIGVLAARTLAIIKNKPLYKINHVQAHVYANFITEDRRQKLEDSAAPPTIYHLPSTIPAFPMLALIVSGGHSQLALFKSHTDYTLLGQTNDDAIGEAFDKVAKIIGLPYPGGPSVGKKALEGNPHAYQLPKAHMASKYDFSFSGLKTAVLRTAQHAVGGDFTLPSTQLPTLLNEQQKADIAASFQRIAIETVVDKTLLAFEEFQPASVVIAGGVAASPELRKQLAERLPIAINYTDPKLCTDNGAMIATLAYYLASEDQALADPYTLDVQPNLSM